MTRFTDYPPATNIGIMQPMGLWQVTSVHAVMSYERFSSCFNKFFQLYSEWSEPSVESESVLCKTREGARAYPRRLARTPAAEQTLHESDSTKQK